MEKSENNKLVDRIIRVILIIIIIFLLIHNCALLKKNKEYQNKPGDNVDIIEINCNNDSCKNKEVESLEFTQNNISVKKGENIKLTVIVNPTELSNSKFTWTSSDESIVTVDSNGNIKGIKPGKAEITVTSSNGKKAVCTVNVVEETVDVQKILLTINKKNINVGSTTQIKAKIEPENATNRELVWTTSDKNIATVDENGVVKGKKSGTVTITAKTKDGKVVASTKITINDVPKKIESLSFAQNNVSIKKGDTTKLIVTVKPTELSNSKLTWTSSDESIVSVDIYGNIKGIKPGKAQITVTSSNGKKAECTVNVIEEEIKLEEIILTPSKDKIEKDEMTQIGGVFKPEKATNRELVWTTSDKNIATVDENGVVKGINEGTVTITAKTKDGKVVASTTITINEKEENKIFGVSDELNTPITWNGSSDLKIFEKTQYTMDGRIAPESSNTYEFKVKNGTGYNLKYNISFVESNPHNINMKYKLKKNDEYIIDHYVTTSELNVPEMLLNSKINDTYYLEWKWISSDNDTEIGKTGNVNYNLKIIVEAESTNG